MFFTRSTRAMARSPEARDMYGGRRIVRRPAAAVKGHGASGGSPLQNKLGPAFVRCSRAVPWARPYVPRRIDSPLDPEPESLVHRALRADRPRANLPAPPLRLWRPAGTPRVPRAGLHLPRDHRGRPPHPPLRLRRRLHAGSPLRHAGQREGHRLDRGRSAAHRPRARGRRRRLVPDGADPPARARFRRRAHGRGTDVQGVDRHDPPRPGHRRAAGGRRPRDLRRDLGRHAHHPRAGGGQAGGGDVPPEGRRARGQCQPGSDHPALQHRGRHRGGDARRGRSLGPDRSRGRGGAARRRQQQRQPRRSRDAHLPLRHHPLRRGAAGRARWRACSPEPRVGRYRVRSASWTHRPSIRRATWWRSSGAAIPRSAARWSRSAPTTTTTGSSRRRWTTIRSAPSIA